MKGKLRILVTLSTMMTVLMLSTVTAFAQRLSGDSRYKTMRSIAESYSSGKISNVLVASGENFPDALSASVLSKKYDAPILLVSKTDWQDALAYIQAHLVDGGSVYILGGTGVVPVAFEDTVKNSGFTIARLGGANRFETNARIIENANIPTGTPIILANAANFPDALSVSSISGIKGYPIILTDAAGLNDTNAILVKNIAPSKIYVVGGAAAVSEATKAYAQSLAGIGDSSVIRLWGSDRYETSLNIAKAFEFSTDTAIIAYGGNFPDALAGSALAIKLGSPILLTDGVNVANQKVYMKDKNLTKNIILGGTGVINNNVETKLNTIGLTYDELVAKLPSIGVTPTEKWEYTIDGGLSLDGVPILCWKYMNRDNPNYPFINLWIQEVNGNMEYHIDRSGVAIDSKAISILKLLFPNSWEYVTKRVYSNFTFKWLDPTTPHFDSFTPGTEVIDGRTVEFTKYQGYIIIK